MLVFQIEKTSSHKHIGRMLQNDCTGGIHIKNIIKRVSPMIKCLRSLKYGFTRNTLNRMHTSFILPIFDYCSHISDNYTTTQAPILENLHLDTSHTIHGAVCSTCHDRIYSETSSVSFYERRKIAKLAAFFKMYHDRLPYYPNELVPLFISQASTYPLRNVSHLQAIAWCTAPYDNSFLLDQTWHCTSVWTSALHVDEIITNITGWRWIVLPITGIMSSGTSPQLMFRVDAGPRCFRLDVRKGQLCTGGGGDSEEVFLEECHIFLGSFVRMICRGRW